MIPFWLVRTMTSWRETLAVWFPLSVIGGTFASVQFLWSNYVGFELVDIVSSVASMVAGVIVIRLWRPERDLAVRAGHRGRPCVLRERVALLGEPIPDELTVARVARAWMPFALLTVTVLIWGIPAIKPWGTPAVKDWLDERLSWKPELSWLHLKIAKGTAVTGHETPRARGLREGPGRDRPAVVHGHGRVSGRRRQRLLAGPAHDQDGAPPRRDRPPDDPGHRRDSLHAGAGLRDQVLGDGRRARPGIHPDRAAALPDLRHAARLARRGPDRLGHLEQRPLRQPAEDHRAEIRARPGPHGFGQFDRGRDGQDDRCSIDRRRRGGHGGGGHEGELLRAVFWHSILLALLVGAIVWVYAHVLPGVVAAAAATPG